MDDLIHENGHHFLNAFLNVQDLFTEDDEKDYYSPWRQALRPIRGIYHACFTFYWGLNLFDDLLTGHPPLNEEEREKIKRRFLEEYYMLDYCYPDLVHAHKENKINTQGMELIEQIYEEIRKKAHNVESILASLKDKEAIGELKARLKKAQKTYRLE
jgi:hypothetical protein